jgi:hypothetical protein
MNTRFRIAIESVYKMEHYSNLNWQEHIDAGQKYLSTAVKGLSRSSVFTNDLVHQLTAMAIEHLLSGIYLFHGQMPTDHTLDGLVDGLAPFCPLGTQLAESIKQLNQYDDMCPLVPVGRVVPDDMAIQAMLALGKQVAGFVELHVKPSVSDQVPRESQGMDSECNRAS